MSGRRSAFQAPARIQALARADELGEVVATELVLGDPVDLPARRHSLDVDPRGGMSRPAVPLEGDGIVEVGVQRGRVADVEEGRVADLSRHDAVAVGGQRSEQRPGIGVVGG